MYAVFADSHSSKYNSFTDLVHQRHGPGVRVQETRQFLHDGAENLVELQRRGEGLAELVENATPYFPVFDGSSGFQRRSSALTSSLHQTI